MHDSDHELGQVLRSRLGRLTIPGTGLRCLLRFTRTEEGFPMRRRLSVARLRRVFAVPDNETPFRTDLQSCFICVDSIKPRGLPFVPSSTSLAAVAW